MFVKPAGTGSSVGVSKAKNRQSLAEALANAAKFDDKVLVEEFIRGKEIEVAVTRNSPFPEEEDTDMYRWPEQAITAYQALEAYTKNVAFENYMEDKVGTLEVGKLADLTVLDQDILNCDPKKISDTKVLFTVSDGRIVYEG